MNIMTIRLPLLAGSLLLVLGWQVAVAQTQDANAPADQQTPVEESADAASGDAMSAATESKRLQNLRAAPVVQGDAQAGAGKAEVCAACHGQDGNALVPDFPSLAGQPATYLYLQLRAYKDESRPNPIMKPLVDMLDDQDFKDLAAYYATLQPRATATEANDTSAGHSLFTAGAPARGVPACQGCHGVAGVGVRDGGIAGRPVVPWHTYPALAGQQAPYIVAQLKAYQSGERSFTSNAQIMQSVVSGLTEQDMQQVADYLSRLPAQ